MKTSLKGEETIQGRKLYEGIYGNSILHLMFVALEVPNFFYVHTVFPHIVSSLEYFPPLNSFLTSVRKLFKFLLHKGKINEETIRNFQGLKTPKKNSCRGNYMRKYGILNFIFRIQVLVIKMLVVP